MAKVFVSHSSADKPFARKLVAELHAHGIDVWFDEWEMRPGDSLIRKIISGIQESAFVIAIISKSSIQSSWVRVELEAALSLEVGGSNIIIIPVLIEDEVALPLMLLSKIYVSFPKGYDAAFDSLVARIKDMQIRPPVPEEEKELTPYDIVDFHWRADLLDDHGADNALVITSRIIGRNATTKKITVNELTAAEGILTLESCSATDNFELINVGGAYSAVANLPHPLVKGEEFDISFYFKLSGVFSTNPCTFVQRVDDPILNDLTITIRMPISSPAVANTTVANQLAHKKELDSNNLLQCSADGTLIEFKKNRPIHGSRYIIKWVRAFPPKF